jgi:hypothetical protein
MDNQPKTTDEVSYTLVLPRELHTRLKMMCASEAISIKNYLTDLIERDLEKKVLPLNKIKK